MRKSAGPARARLAVTILAVAAVAACGDRRARSEDEALSVTQTDASSADGPQSIIMSPEMRQSREAIARAPANGNGDGAASSPALAADAVSVGAAANAAMASAPTPPSEAPSPTALTAQGTPLPRFDASGAMLVRQGQASIEVNRVDDAVQRVRRSAAQFHGFVANTSLSSGKDERRSARIELRVPTDQFDALLASLGALGQVESVTAQVQDMSEEYVDLGARLANARRVEARLLEMLAARTGTLSDVLRVEQELARVRMEAERYDARIRWIERRSALSSLEIVLHEKLPIIEPQRGPGPIVRALAQAWSNALGVLAWLIASLGLLVPLGLLLGAGYVFARRVLRGRTPPGASQA